MNIIDFLSSLADKLPTSPINFATLEKPFKIQSAIETNNSDLLKSFISKKTFYANEDKVTVF